jgi:hypothetical protein
MKFTEVFEEHRENSTKLHGLASQKAAFFTASAKTTSNFTEA